MSALRVVHVDAACLVVDKPPGLLSVPGRGEAGRDCLAARVQAVFADACVVHRLDMATSGLMLFARGADAQRALGRAFAQRAVGKRYVAVVHGRVAPAHGTIDLPLRADWPNRPRQQVDRVAGKPSLTRYRTIAADDGPGTAAGAVGDPDGGAPGLPDFLAGPMPPTRRPGAEPGAPTTRLALEPVTGRSHQLRVHLLAIGHPIVGDALYDAARAAGAPRLLLHASSLAFAHPAGGAALCFESAAPF